MEKYSKIPNVQKGNIYKYYKFTNEEIEKK